MGAGKRKSNRIIIFVPILCLCIAACSVGGIYAYLTTGTDSLYNEFAPAKVTCVVEENFADGIKSDVMVRNTSNVDAFIRVAVVATFVSQDGKVLATAPKEGVDYVVNWSAAGWRKGTDGYWYHAKPVAPGETTTQLIENAAVVSAPTDFRLHIQILATALQSAPDSAVQEAWGVDVINGEIAPN